MTTEAALSGALSIAILILATLKRTGVLDAGWELLKKRFQKRQQQAVEVVGVSSAPTKVKEEPRNLLTIREILERHQKERERLDEEFALINEFLFGKKEK